MHQGATWNDRDNDENMTLGRDEHFSDLAGCFIVQFFLNGQITHNIYYNFEKYPMI